MPVHPRLGATLLLVGLTLLAPAAPAQAPARDAPGYELTATLQGTRVRTLLSPEGVVTSHFADSSRPDALTRQFIVRYADQRVWAVDGSTGEHLASTLAATFEGVRSRMTHILGTAPVVSEARALPRGARIRPLPDTATVDGIRLTAYRLDDASVSWRVWVAQSLPRAPARYRAGLASLIPADPTSAGALAKMVGFPVIRTDLLVADRWQPVYTTQTIRRVLVRGAEFEPPAGSRERPSRPSGPTRRDPATPGGADVPANVIRGIGPEMGNPELEVVFWGAALNDTRNQTGKAALMAGINDIVSPPYVTPLRQYSVNSARITGVHSRTDLPPRAVGSSNFAMISAMVYDVGFRDGAPIFWWSVGGHDPLYAILAASSEVDNAGWDGYHFVAFSLTHAVLPFPASLFAHDAIPWLFVRIPDAALATPAGAQLVRFDCVSPAALKRPPATTCNPIRALDDGTTAIAHEFVETATDPYVFLGWSDPGQQPAWVKSEVADICDFNAAPWASATVVGHTMVNTYWSNADQACVPASLPRITIFEPAVSSTVSSTDGRVVLRGLAQDPVEGEITPRLKWDIDGAPVTDTGGTVTTTPLTAGVHTANVTVANRLGGTASNAVSFVLKLPPITLTLDAPVDGGNYPAGQPLTFRGDGFTYQPGDVPDAQFRWEDNGTVLGTGRLLLAPLSAGAHQVRLSLLGPGGAVLASREVAVQATAGGKPRPTLVIRTPASGAVIPVAYGKSQSDPVTLTAEVYDGSGNRTSATVTWTSDLQGALGTGATITVPLGGGGCAPSTHLIRARASFGPRRGLQAEDAVKVTVGQVC